MGLAAPKRRQEIREPFAHPRAMRLVVFRERFSLQQCQQPSDPALNFVYILESDTAPYRRVWAP